ncbi:glycosyltransferase family 2 protein [Microvirga antarctica]|uniref:glycosyltransferase family 2 protein n=1 Tax=Microvirga antarctica TaxID=2819233 RepID=UPI001B30DF88|nr:glycosyltransferase family 2 protein [Microvirga antarctica]
MTKQLISIIVPVFNEEANIDRAYDAIVAELESLPGLSFEIIFTDNHSTDSTFSVLERLAARDTRVKVLRFARNFGFNRSILTGYRYARGDAAIQIDCDLEDPPSLFGDFIRLWRDGHDVVVGIRARRREGWLMVLARKSFYRFLDSISDTPHQIDAGDFRLVDRSILDQLKHIDDAQPYVRGLISELARKQGSIAYTRNRREFGESKFPLRQLVKLGLEGVYAHSTVPLRIATYIGLAIALATALTTGIYVIGRLIWPEGWPAGFATTTVLILFGISLNALFLGIMGEYVARIYQQVRHRPTVIVEKALNINASGAVYKEERRHGLQ